MTISADVRTLYTLHRMMTKPATTPTRVEVWFVDLGMVAKIRPCLVFSIPRNDENDRVLARAYSEEVAGGVAGGCGLLGLFFWRPKAFDGGR
jgi:hypothetical protein